MTRVRLIAASAALALVLVLAPGDLNAQMPDISQMSGVPLPTGDIPTGTVSVRVVRGDLSNNVVNQPVELHGAGAVQNATTDENGRATFAGLAPGTEVHAVTTVDGQRLESQGIVVPTNGGMRVILVATVAGTAGQAATPAESPGPSPPAQPGTVALGGQSRFIVDLADEAVDVYCVLEVVNAQATPVEPAEPLVFEAPPGSRGLTMLEGSSPQTKAEGTRVTVSGPFPPGATSVQFAYQVPYAGGSVSVRQVLPVALTQTAVMVRKVGGITFTSPQVANQREVPLNGLPYYVGNGGAIPAGGVLEVSLNGLPYHSRVPRYLALALALAVAGVGVWAARGAAPPQADAERQKLDARRERLFGDLVKLEEQHRAGRGDASRYPAKRRDLMTQLEQVYARLDGLGVGRA